MSESEAIEGGLQLVPRWMPAVVTAATILGTISGVWATVGYRLTSAEQRVQAVETDRKERGAQFDALRIQLATDIQQLKDTQSHQGETLDRIANKLGVVR